MKSGVIIKRLYQDYSKKFLGKIFFADFFSIMVAGATSSIAWLLDPAIKKIFIDKDEALIFLIPALIIITFSAKGVSLYLAKAAMISVGEEIKKLLQDKSFLMQILKNGKEKANIIAEENLKNIREKVGLI